MARIPRCLVTSLDQPELDSATRHHLARVLRTPLGAPLELIDGHGGLLAARWNGGPRPDFDESAAWVPAPSDPTWLAVAPPRPSRLDWLVEKAAELGVDRVLLTHTSHAARTIGKARVLRLQAKANQALLQCRRLHALEVVAERPLLAVLDEAAASVADLWVAAAPEEAGRTGPTAQELQLPPRTPGTPLLGVIGPEGGLSSEELELLATRGAQPVSLGSGVLRVETAALALAARLCR